MTVAGSPRRTIWVDVEDLFQYFVANPRPSGIQRLVFEILCVLPEQARRSPGGPHIAFVRHGGDGALLREVAFDEVARLFERPIGDKTAAQRGRPAPARGQPAARSREPLGERLRHATIRRIQRLPPDLSEVLLRAGVQQMRVLRRARTLAATIRRRPRLAPAAQVAAPPVPPAIAAFAGQAGDVFLILGAPWVTPDYGKLLGQLRARYGLAPALLLYDLIPLRRPEWCAADLVAGFAAWFQTTLPHCTRLLAISQATAADVEAYAVEVGVPLVDFVQPVPIGTGLGRTAQRVVADGQRPLGLPAPGSYVLFVSTLEARKNHALLFRIWRHLLLDLPRARVPTLVFAGRVGWLVSDLLQQLENTAWLDGKIRLLHDPTDAELLALYRGCQFTLFPSLYEGWGLPVSESLALGRPCIASNRTSLPEAGGDLARYFDPENFADAYHAVRTVIEDSAGLAAWRERVAREFRHVPWERTADAILAACSPADAWGAAPVPLKQAQAI